ncbi:MAG: acyl-CoA dehydrogenase [Magnetovibrio sp.]|nr:acyl-CoA dehydrogenase [Magnetovibrio sp.]
MKVDITNLKKWIGKTEEHSEIIFATPMAGLAATLDHSANIAPQMGDALPPAGHWLYFLPKSPMREIGSDGHVKLGGFLPPVGLPRRMWAGGRIEFIRPLCIGDTARRLSTIKSVDYKRGKSGELVFVVVGHEIFAMDQLAIKEEHNIVYREAHEPGKSSPVTKRAPETAKWSREISPDPVLLFRYSALTFNGHRIHYDRPYALNEEGYPGLVVHGPLIATLLMDLCCQENPSSSLVSFDYRAISPLFDIETFTVNGTPGDDNKTASLWAANHTGGVAMQAEAQFQK